MELIKSNLTKKEKEFIKNTKNLKTLKDYEINFLVNSLLTTKILLYKKENKYIVIKGDLKNTFNTLKNAEYFFKKIMPYSYINPITFNAIYPTKKEIFNNKMELV
jgi:hypothetical protein